METDTQLPNSEHVSLSPVVQSFLDGLAELIAESILEEVAQGQIRGNENAPPVSPTSVSNEDL